MTKYEGKWENGSSKAVWVKTGGAGTLEERVVVGRYADGALLVARPGSKNATRVEEAYVLDGEETEAARAAEAKKAEKAAKAAAAEDGKRIVPRKAEGTEEEDA